MLIAIDLCQPRDINEANHFAQLLTEVWNNTFRYELRGRTPDDVSGKPRSNLIDSVATQSYKSPL
jgi:hypothetical protein